MKQSSFNVNFDINEDKGILYNTLTRKYFIYEKNNYDKIDSLLNNINKETYSFDEIEDIKKLMKKGMVIKDAIDELKIIEYRENSSRFSDSSYELQILPTMDCNFRCTYCYEEHNKIRIDDEVEKKIIKLIGNITSNIKKLHISWFGGEPLLEMERIISLTKQTQEICQKNNCKYSSSITTNGYLLDDLKIKMLKELNIEQLQITLDGAEDYHNSKRHLANGHETYDRIIGNILKLINNDYKVTLRINIDSENYEHIDDILDIIPKDKRNLVTIGMFNIFQNKVKIDLFPLLKSAIEKGYKYSFINKQFACELCLKNGLVITPEAKIIPCTIIAEKGYVFGHIGEDGQVIINKNEDLYYNAKIKSTLHNEKCVKCKQLPMCIGTCKFRKIYSEECSDNIINNLSINENILLHYYYDLTNNKQGVETI